MSAPHTPTGVEINGILIDGNRITRREYARIVAAIQACESVLVSDQLSGELVEKIVVHWPFGVPVTRENYFDLTFTQSKMVDNAIVQFGQEIGQKKSESPSIQPASSNGH